MNSRKAGWILRIRPSSGINPRLPNPIFNPILHFFLFFQWILELRGKFWEFGPQVANTVSSHMPSSPQFSIWSVNFRKKRGKFWAFMLQVDNTRGSHMLSLPRFPFFFWKFYKNNGVKSENSSFKWNRSQVVISNLQPDFLCFFFLLEDITTIESLNQSQATCRSIDRRIWLATLSHYARGHICNKRT